MGSDRDGSGSYYLRTGPRTFTSTGHTQGAWQPGEQHMAPVSGIVLHAVERFVAERGADDGLVVARVAYEILGMIAAGEGEVAVEVLRPGRTIELLEATLVIADRPVVRARVWRLQRSDTSAVAGGAAEAMPGPEGLAPWPGSSVWAGGYIASLDIRPLPGGVPGRSRVWLRTDVDLVAGEPASDLARFVGLVDTANGIAVRVPPSSWMFPNVDLTLHLHRTPVGPWVGLDTSVVFGADGVGLTSSVLHDRSGAVGRAEQILTLRPLPGAR